MAEPKTSSAKKIVLWILFVFLLLVIIAEGAGIYYFYSRQDIKAENAKTELESKKVEIVALNQKITSLENELSHYTVDKKETRVIVANDSISLKAGSVEVLPFTVPENCTKVEITAKVTQGNPINFYLINAEREKEAFMRKESFYNWQEAKLLGATEYYFEDTNFTKGDYYLGVSDPTMGIISSSTSSIFYKVTCTCEDITIVYRN